jgi:hypothetical protein
LTRLRGAYHLATALGQVHISDAEIERLGAQAGARGLHRGSHNTISPQRRGHVLEGGLYAGIGVNQKEALWHACSRVSSEGTGR